MTTAAISKLADTDLRDVRCLSCGMKLSSASPVEVFQQHNLWIVALCNYCGKRNPYRVESKGT